MIAPNKFISVQDSILSKSQLLLEVEEADVPLVALYESKKKKFKDVAEFIYALDVLFVLGKIELDADLGIVHYVS